MVIHGWFAIVYWSLVAIGVVAAILAITSGSEKQSAITGTIVFSGVILLYIARILMQRRQNRMQDEAEASSGSGNVAA